MLRELSEDVRIRVKDRLRDFRSIVRQHRHDHAPVKPASAEAKDQPFPVREIEGLLGHAVSAFDDVMSLAESFAPHRSAGVAVSGPQPLQTYFRAEGESHLDGERAFRRDLYRLAKLVLEQKKLNDFRIREGDFAAVHGALEKRDASPDCMPKSTGMNASPWSPPCRPRCSSNSCGKSPSSCRRRKVMSSRSTAAT
jgi:hypothetical protein